MHICVQTPHLHSLMTCAASGLPFPHPYNLDNPVCLTPLWGWVPKWKPWVMDKKPADVIVWGGKGEISEDAVVAYPVYGNNLIHFA